MPPRTRARAALNPEEGPSDQPASVEQMNHTGRSRLITPLDVRNELQELGNTYVDGVPLNTEKTIKQKFSMCRSLARRFMRSQGTAKPKKQDVDNFDLRKLFARTGTRSRSDTFLAFMRQTYPNQNTFNTYLGYWISIFNTCRYKSFGLAKSEVHEIMVESRKASRVVSKNRGENAIPPRMQNIVNITWDMFVDAEKRMRQSEYASADHVAFALRVLLCPRRDDDFARLKWTTKPPPDDDWNYVVVPPRNAGPIHFVFQRYKTRRFYNTQIIHLSNESKYTDIRPDLPELGEILSTYYEKLGQKDKSGFVLVTSDESLSLSAVRARDKLRSIAGEVVQGGGAVGIQALRKIYSSWAAQQDWTVNQRADSAYLMGHSLTESARYNMQGWGQNAADEEDDDAADEAGPAPANAGAAAGPPPAGLVDAVTKVIAILQEAVSGMRPPESIRRVV